MLLRSAIISAAALVLGPFNAANAQVSSDPNDGLRLSREPALENAFSLTWWGRSGHSYFIQHTSDLVSQSWQYLPIIETGENGVLGYGFNTSDPRFFFRLKIVNQTAADPYAADFDGDGISNGVELLRFLDPLKYQDTDGDGVPDDWEMYHFDDLTKVIDATSDQDGDGVTDFESWLMGINPYTPPPDRSAPAWSNGLSLTVTDETAAGFTLSWLAATDSSGPVKYQLYRNGQPEGAPSTGLSREVDITELSGWQRWNVHPLDSAGNYGPSSGIVERYVGEVTDVNLSVRAKARTHGLAKWGFSPLQPEPDSAPVVRSFARRVTTEKQYSQTTLNDGDVDFTITNNNTRTLTEVRTASGGTSEYGGTSLFHHDHPDNNRKSEGSWAADGTWSGTETVISGGDTTTSPLPPEAAPQFNATSGTVIVSTSTSYEVKNTTPDGYDSYAIELSEPIGDADHEDALVSLMPNFENLPWGSSAGASRNWSGDRLSLSLGDSQYKVVVSSTTLGRQYRVRWLEVFYPEAVPDQPAPEPVARASHQVVLEGTGGEVESAVFTLLPPASDGTVSLLNYGVNLSAAGALPINDDYDERVDDSEDENAPPQPWVPDNETPSPVRADGTLALVDLGEVYPYGNNGSLIGSFHPDTSSVVLSVIEGGSRVRLIAVAPEGSGEDGKYTEADWAVVQSGAELWGAYYGRKDGEGNGLPSWRIYMEGLETGRVITNLAVTLYDQTSAALAETYVADMQLIARNWKSGEHYELSGEEPVSLPRPEVELEIDSATVIDDSILRVALSGVVRDPLSELMTDASQRMQGLVIYVNGTAVAGVGGLHGVAGSPTGVRPWQPFVFEAPFSKTFEVPVNSSGGFLIRAQTAPNAAGQRGWAEAYVATGRQAVDNPAPSLTQMTLQWAATPSATTVDQIRVAYGSSPPASSDPLLTETGIDTNVFTGQLLVSGVARAADVIVSFDAASYPSPTAVDARLVYQDAAGTAVQVQGRWDRLQSDPLSYRLEKTYPDEGVLPPLKVLGYSNLGGTTEEAFAPVVLRIDGLQEADDGEDGMRFSLTDGSGALGLVEPFTFSPEYHYLVRPSFRNAPELLIATSPKLYAAEERVGVLKAGLNNYALRVPGHAAIPGTSVYVVAESGGGSPDTPPTREATLADVMLWYEFLFNRPELPQVNQKPAPIYLRDVFEDANCAYQVVESSEVEGTYLSNYPSRLVVKVGSELDPISGAFALLEAYESLVHTAPIETRLHSTPELLAQRNASAKAAIAPLRELGLSVMEAQFAFLNEGADVVMSVQEVADGNMYAALGILPGVPSSINKVIVGVGVGAAAQNLVLQGPALQAFKAYLSQVKPALRYSKKKVDRVLGAAGARARLAFMNDFAHLFSREQLGLMYDRLSVLRSDGNRTVLTEQLIANGKPKPGLNFAPHHDLPVAFEPDFIMAGIDPNHHEYGRWIPKSIHDLWSNAPGFPSGGPFNAEWRKFFRTQEGDVIPRTKVEIIAEMNRIRQMPKFRYP